MKNYTLQSCPLSQASKACNTKPAIRTRTRPEPTPPSQAPNAGGSSIPAACAPPVLTKKFQSALSKALGTGDQTPLVHVSIDRDKTGGHVFAALGLGQAHDLGKRSLDEFHHLIGHLSSQGWKLIVVQESCGFGYELHRTLAAMPGVEAPSALLPKVRSRATAITVTLRGGDESQRLGADQPPHHRWSWWFGKR